MRPDDQPTVSQMAEVAIKKLEKNPNGFYLFVEGGQIDFGHHGNEAIAALYEFKVRALQTPWTPVSGPLQTPGPGKRGHSRKPVIRI